MSNPNGGAVETSLLEPGTVEVAVEDALYAAQSLLDNGNPNGAEAIAKIVLKRVPKECRANLMLGEIHLERREFEAADGCFERVLSLDPASATGYIGRALVAEAEGGAEIALEGYNAAVQLDPSLTVIRERASEITGSTDAGPTPAALAMLRMATNDPLGLLAEYPRLTTEVRAQPFIRIALIEALWSVGRRDEATALADGELAGDLSQAVQPSLISTWNRWLHNGGDDAGMLGVLDPTGYLVAMHGAASPYGWNWQVEPPAPVQLPESLVQAAEAPVVPPVEGTTVDAAPAPVEQVARFEGAIENDQAPDAWQPAATESRRGDEVEVEVEPDTVLQEGAAPISQADRDALRELYGDDYNENPDEDRSWWSDPSSPDPAAETTPEAQLDPWASYTESAAPKPADASDIDPWTGLPRVEPADSDPLAHEPAEAVPSNPWAYMDTEGDGEDDQAASGRTAQTDAEAHEEPYQGWGAATAETYPIAPAEPETPTELPTPQPEVDLPTPAPEIQPTTPMPDAEPIYTPEPEIGDVPPAPQPETEPVYTPEPDTGYDAPIHEPPLNAAEEGELGLVSRAEALEEAGYHADALEIYARALRSGEVGADELLPRISALEPHLLGHAPWHRLLGDLYRRTGLPRRAMREYQQALSIQRRKS